MIEKLGVFDSGLGGLTVLNEICKVNTIPQLVYFGDTARVPYGSRTEPVIARYAKQDVKFLLSQGVEAIVVACGTVSAIALPFLHECFDIPIVGVLSAAADAALAKTKTGHIAVLGTAATIRSGAYERTIRLREPAVRVTALACPLFVPLIENGFTADDPITRMCVERYLAPLRDSDVDTVIMGCTHYPFLRSAMEELLPKVVFIDIGHALAQSIRRLLNVPATPCTPTVRYFVSDSDTGFLAIAKRFLDAVDADDAEQINIEQY